MKKLLATLLLLIASSAFAEWTTIMLSPEGSLTAVDWKTLKVTGGKRRIWVLNNFLIPKDDVKSFKGLMEIDCIQKRSHFLQASMFSEGEAKGSVISPTLQEQPWEFIAPDSDLQNTASVICSR